MNRKCELRIVIHGDEKRAYVHKCYANSNMEEADIKKLNNSGILDDIGEEIKFEMIFDWLDNISEG